MIKYKLSGPFTASILTFGWLLIFFHAVFINPNAHIFNEYGDGIKAFFVYADHIKNDESYHQQYNMNYPYGQTFVFTDGQPAIANTFKFISHFIPFFQTHSIAIYNYLIICSFILCAWFIALILQRLKLPFVFVALGGFCIAALSPQIWRISGHPTMSYAFFFPLSWYLLLKLIDSGYKMRLLILLILNTTFWFFVHPYLGMVVTFFYGFYFIALLISTKRRQLFSLRIVISILILLIFPIMVLKLYTFQYDHHLFRSELPWGFWIFYTTPGPIFLPHSGPFAPVFEYILSFKSINWDMEKLNYVGLAVDAILLFTIFRLLRFVYGRNISRLTSPVTNSKLSTSFVAAVFTLLFAMCIPFKYGMQSIVDHIGFLRQFRALGRFGWVFYYVGTVFGVYSFYLVFRFLMFKKLRLLASTLLVVFFSMFIIEAYSDVKEKAKWAVIPKNLFNENLLPQEYSSLISEVNKYKETHQCFVTLPFFHVGTENFGVEFGEDNIRTSCVVSYWCNFPQMSSSAARSPIVEGKNIMQFFSPGFIKKEIERDLPSKKDFLILYNKEPLNNEERNLLERSSKLFDNGKYELWSLPYKNVFSDNSAEVIGKYNGRHDSLISKNIFQVSPNTDTIAYSSFDSLPSEFVYKGNGALAVKKKDFTVLFQADGKLKQDIDYNISFWYYNKGELRNQVLCAVEECDRDGNNCRWDITWDPRSSMVIDGDWSLVEKKFRIKDATEKIKIFVQGDEHSMQDIYIDEFMLRPLASEVYSKIKSGNDTYLFYNNWWIRQ